MSTLAPDLATPDSETTATTATVAGVELAPGAATPLARELLTDEARALLAHLHRTLEKERQLLLAARRERQARWDAGALPGYLERDSEAVRGNWRVAEIPTDLRRRRVEITGPVSDPKMVIQMLSRSDLGYRADTAMLDFEDSMKPTWWNVLAGVRNVRDAVAGTLEFVKEEPDGQHKIYRLDPDDQAVLMVRVRGLHLDETHVRVDGEPVAGGLFDLLLSLVHAARRQVAQGRTPTFYVPKVEHFTEARWWNRLFVLAQEGLGLPVGTLRATFLIETLPAAFQMEEILYEIRQHAAGLNVGRWDKIFSDIKVLGRHADRVMADRATIGLERPWMRSYALRLIQVCHRRGAYALGGMAAFTPGRTPELRRAQTEKVVADKELEASFGHDGCWVSHPYFIGPALSAFEHEHQLDVLHQDLDPWPELLPEGTGPHTLEGLRTNVRVGIGYLEGWNRGIGCVAWDDLMEDLATLEISRAQTWQWLDHGIRLDDGTRVDKALVHRLFTEELDTILAEIDGAGLSPAAAEERRRAFTRAKEDAEQIFTEARLRPFLGSRPEIT